jgi:hypothetical protein
MAGLVLDNIVVFLFWIIRQLIIDFRTRSWPTTTAIISDANADSSMYPQTTAHYRYEVNGEEFYGEYTKHFWYRNSAYNFAIDMKRSPKISVRFDPNSPSHSFVRESDMPTR